MLFQVQFVEAFRIIIFPREEATFLTMHSLMEIGTVTLAPISNKTGIQTIPVLGIRLWICMQISSYQQSAC